MILFGKKPQYKKRPNPSEPTPVNVSPQHPTDDDPKPVAKDEPKAVEQPTEQP